MKGQNTDLFPTYTSIVSKKNGSKLILNLKNNKKYKKSKKN